MYQPFNCIGNDSLKHHESRTTLDAKQVMKETEYEGKGVGLGGGEGVREEGEGGGESW